MLMMDTEELQRPGGCESEADRPGRTRPGRLRVSQVSDPIRSVLSPKLSTCTPSRSSSET